MLKGMGATVITRRNKVAICHGEFVQPFVILLLRVSPKLVGPTEANRQTSQPGWDVQIRAKWVVKDLVCLSTEE